MATPQDLRERPSRLTPHGSVRSAIRTPLEPLFRGRTGTMPHAFSEQFMRTPGEPFRVVLDGVMHEIWYQPLLTPLFQMFGRLGVLVPVAGRNVPTRLLVRPGKTAAGQPFHVLDRSFDVDPPARFRTTIVYDPHIDHLVELVGPRNLLHMVWEARFEPPLMFTLDSVAIALQVGNRRIWLPDWFWPWAFGVVKFQQRAEKVDGDMIVVDLRITHPLLGKVFAYNGTFRARRVPLAQPTGLATDAPR